MGPYGPQPGLGPNPGPGLHIWFWWTPYLVWWVQAYLVHKSIIPQLLGQFPCHSSLDSCYMGKVYPTDFGFKSKFLMKFLDDSAWFCVEKLKKHAILNKKHKFGDKTWKGVISEKIFPLVRSKYLSSWTGLGRSGHDQITTFVPISQASGPKLGF